MAAPASGHARPEAAAGIRGADRCEERAVARGLCAGQVGPRRRRAPRRPVEGVHEDHRPDAGRREPRFSARGARSRARRERGARRPADPRRAPAEIGHHDGVRRAGEWIAADVRGSKRGSDRARRSRNAIAMGRLRHLHVRQAERHAARDVDHGTGVLVRVVGVPSEDDDLRGAGSMTARRDGSRSSRERLALGVVHR